ncbi:MAG: beta-galactosidase, partial [Verrucomicrobiaceae bacterium]
ILPASLCLSDAEARQIATFCERGGTVIADYLPGVWDQHGRGRSAGGALDQMFGVKHNPEMSAGDIFGEKLWAEVDQDANYSWKTYEEFLTNKNTALKDASGFHKAVRAMTVNQTRSHGRGTAVLMNLSPQWYNAYRVAGAEASRKREVFMRHVEAAGVAPRVRIKNASEAEHGYEITYWSKRDATGLERTILFLFLNPETRGNSLGGGNSVGLKTATLPVVLQFTQGIKGLRDERTGKSLGDGQEFVCDWKQNEALVLSFDR